ncbi:O-antigen ligase family protein [Azospirillum sp.]|uniref:O-antigen ligase family protein n=1 Tax=Azospirillum sp. TaxID=34012 RepID=UPI003D7534B1
MSDMTVRIAPIPPLRGFALQPVVLTVVVLFITSLVTFHDLSFPLSLLNGSVSDEQQLAAQAGEGSLLRRLFIPAVGLLGLHLLLRPHGRRAAVASPLGLVFVSYVGWAALSLFWSTAPDLTLRRLTVFLIHLVGAIGVATLAPRAMRSVFVWVTLANLAVGVLNELHLGTFAPFAAEYRFSGTVHPNLQGSTAAQLALTGLCLCLPGDERRTRAGAALLILGTATVFLTQSRTSLICLVLAAAAVVAVWSWRRSARTFLVALALCGLAGSALTLAEAVAPDASPVAGVLAALEKPRDEGNIGALTGRTDIWETCLAFAAERPLTGAGFDSFWTPQRILEISALHQWGINQAHSMYVEHLISLGIVGLALWCVLLLGGLVAGLRRYAAAPSGGTLWMLGQLGFYLFHGFNESINIMPLFGGFALMMILAHLALFRARRESAP